MIGNRDWVFADLGVSTDQAIEAFKALGGSFANCKINEDSLQELKIPSSVICPDNAKSNIEFFPTHDIITQLEARIAKLEKLVDELRTNAIEKPKTQNKKVIQKFLTKKMKLKMIIYLTSMLIYLTKKQKQIGMEFQNGLDKEE